MALRTDDGRLDGLTRRFADYAARLRLADVSGEALLQAKRIMRDGIGNQIAASAISESGAKVVELAREWGGAPQATVVAHGIKLPAPAAALCNATFGHGVELDDAHGTGLIKAGSILIPAAFVAAELAGADGKDTLTALVAGYEIAVRIAKSINPGHRQRGYHTTSTVGCIAAAAITAKLLRCGPEQIASALGLAAMHAGGIQAYLDDPCMAKPLGPGRAAMNGVMAGILASRGFTGPTTALECKEGFFNAFTGSVRTEDLVDGLGETFVILEVGFKPHSACRYVHGAIDAAQHVRRESRVGVHDIESVGVRMSELAVRQASVFPCPGLNTAMGSTQFGVALAFARGGNGLRDYWDGFADPSIHALGARVAVHIEPAFGVAGRQTVLEVRLKDGRRIEYRQEVPKGEPSNPLTADELERKFLATAGMVIDESQARAISRTVMQLEGEAKPAGVLSMTVAPQARPALRVAHA